MSKVSVTQPKGGGGGNLPAGVIVMWSGAVADVPGGWALCDGTSGTPDLRGRFVVGAGDQYSVGDTGGAASVTLTVNQIPAHSHVIKNYEPNSGQLSGKVGGRGNQYTELSPSATTENAGGGKSHENRPPYYALCYIMKL